MKKLLLALFVVCLMGPTTTTNVEASVCHGCSCTTECWKNGVCRTVCRDSCGRFCFTEYYTK